MVVLRPRGNADLGLQIGPGTREKEIEFERDTGFPKTRAQALRFGSINSITLADRNRGDFRPKQRFSRFRLYIRRFYENQRF